jgi:hypothetical protein
MCQCTSTPRHRLLATAALIVPASLLPTIAALAAMEAAQAG